MRTLICFVLALAVACAAAGCGDKQDNSKVQTPDDKPIGPPQKLDGGVKGNESLQKGKSAPRTR
jgi:hypothetical protein